MQELQKYRPDGLRQNVKKINGRTYIIDCYNASPDSMKAAINVLSNTNTGGRKYCVLADMLELGKLSKTLHRTVGEYVFESKIDMLLCFGDDSKYYIDGALKKGFDSSRCLHFESREKLTEYLRNNINTNDAVLFKGSRGMKLEEVVNALE